MNKCRFFVFIFMCSNFEVRILHLFCTISFPFGFCMCFVFQNWPFLIQISVNFQEMWAFVAWLIYSKHSILQSKQSKQAKCWKYQPNTNHRRANQIYWKKFIRKRNSAQNAHSDWISNTPMCWFWSNIYAAMGLCCQDASPVCVLSSKRTLEQWF